MAERPYRPPVETAHSRESDPETAQLECFRERLRIFAARHLGDWTEAEDVAQETLGRALEALRAGRVVGRVVLTA